MTPVLGLVGCLVLPSLALVQKYLGNAGLLPYLAIVLLAMGAVPRRRLSDRTALICAAGTLAALAIVLAIAFPLANSGLYGPGSDTDESYDLAVMSLVRGEYPYHVRTYLGNGLNYWPGSLALATPFVLLGSSAYQNLFWIAMFYLVARSVFGDASEALFLLWTLLLLCPAVLHQMVTGLDWFTNGLAVMVSFWYLARASRPSAKVAAIALFATALSSRPNFLLVLPIALAWCWQQYGLREALVRVGIPCALLLVINVPFYVYDPAGFTPLRAADRLTRFESVLPYAGLLLPGVAVALAVGWATRTRSMRDAFAGFAVTQAFFVVSGVVLDSIGRGSLQLEYSGYGAFLVGAGSLATWDAWRSPERGSLLPQEPCHAT